jgi:DNA polymerase III alpha subunit
MKNDQYGQIVYNDNDLIDLIMQGRNVSELSGILVDSKELNFDLLDQKPDFKPYVESLMSVHEFDQQNQSRWHMPDEYQQIDIAEHILSLCTTQEQLQRCGTELLLYQERNLFDLLRYLKYLVDVMKQHNIIWGVGRGSSVSSYVLYLLEVHKIDSIYYNLDVAEFLR